MERFGFDVLISRKSWLRWLKDNLLSEYSNQEPREYPCIAEERLGSDENAYPEYIYMETVEKMRQALTL